MQIQLLVKDLTHIRTQHIVNVQYYIWATQHIFLYILNQFNTCITNTIII
jgi:hypothetical protein